MAFFENMKHLDIPVPITHENLKESIALLPEINRMLSASDPTVDDYLAPASSAEFCISGTAYFLTPILISHTARDHYLYIKAISVFDVDESFYTHRTYDESYMLLYVLSGKGKMEYEGRTVSLSRSDGIWIDCRKEHYYKAVSSSWCYAAIHFYGVSSDALYNEFISGCGNAFHKEEGSSFYQLLEQLISAYGAITYGREVKIASTLMNMLSILISESAANIGKTDNAGLDNSFKNVLEYIDTHMNENITLNDLSEIVHLSKYHFSHLFQRLIGCSPIDYLIQMRIKKACFLLRTTSLSVSKIAEMTGIENNQYFGKLFKKKMHMTPGEYRKANMIGNSQRPE